MSFDDWWRVNDYSGDRAIARVAWHAAMSRAAKIARELAGECNQRDPEELFARNRLERAAERIEGRR